MSGRVGRGGEWTEAEADHWWWGELAERPVPEAMATLDLATITDVSARPAIRALLTLVEELAAEVQALRTEHQHLRDELRRLPGGSGRPKDPPGKAAGGSLDYASEQERRSAPTSWHQRGTQDRVRIDRTERLAVDPATLPADAVFKGDETVVVQDLVLRTDTVAFELAVWYSASEGRSARARRPAGYAGAFGPHPRGLVLTLAYGGQLSERKILELVPGAGIEVSAGTRSDLLTEGRVACTAEAQAVLAAGLGSGPWQHLDDTSTRVNGAGHACHSLCNPRYTAYQTTLKKDRLTVIDGLGGGRPRAYRFERAADRHLAWLGLAADARTKLTAIPREQELDEAALTALPAGPARGLGPRAAARGARGVGARGVPGLAERAGGAGAGLRRRAPGPCGHPGAGALLDPRRPALQEPDPVPAPVPLLCSLRSSSSSGRPPARCWRSATNRPPRSGHAWTPDSTSCSGPRLGTRRAINGWP